jgi:hypothetical protein
MGQQGRAGRKPDGRANLWPMDFNAYLADLPALHSWDRGKTWNTGGFNARRLRRVHALIGERFRDRAVSVLETGAGNSTITFLHLRLERLVAIAPAADLRDRILDYCAAHQIDTSPLDFRLERSEIELPAIALGVAGGTTPTPASRFDVVLIDGAHGWPTVFVDFCYANMMMRSGSLLLLDDIQVYAVGELARLLELQPGFTLKEELGKLQVWEKETDRQFLPGHLQEPYIVAMSKKSGDKRRDADSDTDAPAHPPAD